MKSLIFILTLVFSLLMIACEQNRKESRYKASMLVYNKIEGVKIVKVLSKGEEVENIQRVLSKSQIKAFVNNWNISKSIGPCKYVLEYLIIVKLKDGTERKFRSNGPNVKERDDWCFDFGVNDFIRTLYLNASTLDKLKIDIVLMQGSWLHSKDSTALVSVNDYTWRFHRLNERQKKSDIYTVIFKEKLSDFVKDTVVADFFILSSADDSLYYEIVGLTDTTFSMIHFPSGRVHLYHKYNKIAQ